MTFNKYEPLILDGVSELEYLFGAPVVMIGVVANFRIVATIVNQLLVTIGSILGWCFPPSVGGSSKDGKLRILFDLQGEGIQTLFSNYVHHAKKHNFCRLKH